MTRILPRRDRIELSGRAAPTAAWPLRRRWRGVGLSFLSGLVLLLLAVPRVSVVIEVDADPGTPGVQASRTVSPDEVFDVVVRIGQIAANDGAAAKRMDA